MEFFDEELLNAEREIKRQMHTNLKTGMYAGEELITFTEKLLPNTSVYISLPDQFVIMPDEVKRVKYPSKDAPHLIMTSLDSMVNLCFNILPNELRDKEIEDMSSQIQNALKNVNPSIIVKGQMNTKTDYGNELSWIEYKGYQLDGQSFNRVYLIRLRKGVLYAQFSCLLKDKDKWKNILDKIFSKVHEDL